MAGLMGRPDRLEGLINLLVLALLSVGVRAKGEPPIDNLDFGVPLAACKDCRLLLRSRILTALSSSASASTSTFAADFAGVPTGVLLLDLKLDVEPRGFVRFLITITGELSSSSILRNLAVRTQLHTQCSSQCCCLQV